MAASGYTPIILFNSTTTGNTPTTSNLAVGELAINVTDGKLFFNQSGTIKVLANATYATSVSTISFGTTGLTPSTATNGVVTVAGTLAVANGGTGLTSLTANYIPYGNGTSAFANSSIFQFNGTNFGVGGAPISTVRQYIKGTGTTSSTWSLYIDNSTPTNIFAVRDDGYVGMGTSAPPFPLTVQNDSLQVRLRASTNTNLGLTLGYSYSGGYGQINCDEQGVNQKNLWYTALNHFWGRNTSSASTTIDSSGLMGGGAAAGSYNSSRALNVATGITYGYGLYTYASIDTNSVASLIYTANSNPANLGTTSFHTFRAGTSGGGGPYTIFNINGVGNAILGSSISTPSAWVSGDYNGLEIGSVGNSIYGGQGGFSPMAMTSNAYVSGASTTYTKPYSGSSGVVRIQGSNFSWQVSNSTSVGTITDLFITMSSDSAGNFYVNGNNYPSGTATGILITDHGATTSQYAKQAYIDFCGRYWSGDNNAANHAQIAMYHDQGDGNTGTGIGLLTASLGTSTPTLKVYVDGAGNLLVGGTNLAGSVSNSAQVVGGWFKSVSGSVSLPTNTTTTVLTFPSNAGMYLVTMILSGTGAPTTDNACALVCINASSSSSTDIKTGSNMVISVSGLNLQANQKIFAGANVNWSVIRIGS